MIQINGDYDIIADYQIYEYVVVCEFKYTDTDDSQSIQLFLTDVKKCDEKYQDKKNKILII